jgi:LmbE family N-acetylglucosaminyl deacetylase
MRRALLLGLLTGWAAAAQTRPAVLVITADASGYLLSAGGTLAGMIRQGADVTVVRVTNDEKDAWDLIPEEAARRTRAESEAAGRILGVRNVISLGYRAAELADVPFTTLRDRLILLIRHYRPDVLFIPNAYTEYDRVLDRYYTGRAAEDAWRSAALDNAVPPFGVMGVPPHLTPEVYYYAPPLDPRRREPESTATFAPEPRVVDIAGTWAVKLKAVQALKTINHSMAVRLKNRLSATGRRLPLLDVVNEASVDKLVEENVRGLGQAEEFQYAGVAFRIPRKYRTPRAQ